MWARTMETALAVWLALAPFVFAHGPRSDLWLHDLAAAGVVALLALLSFVPRFRRAHLGLLLVAAWLVGFGYVGSGQGGHVPAAQNHLAVGLLLLLFAIVPSDASAPPTGRPRGDPPHARTHS